MLTMLSVAVAYRGQDVVAGFSLELTAGQAVVLRGRNGAGKSTLLRAVCGVLPVRSGTILVDGSAADETRADFRRTVCALLDDAAWYPSLTVMEHVELVRLVAGDPPPGWWTPVELAATLGLEDLAGRSPAQLSSGQRQRLALAMAFARSSRLLLLDEPERHLDEDGRTVLGALLARYLDLGGAVLMATHDPGLSTAGRVVDLDRG
ncbi:ABC transporter ATP-binding protein [Winogradskya consettensis]|uniref:ABC transporter ATP-binding protein n=2 Tax=Winogradskya consettensis TaxID=113560 RepID=A0A919SL77_9ACTN|nr:ABC transporter ATP-binding protein [Actinoplanes consettensis]